MIQRSMLAVMSQKSCCGSDAAITTIIRTMPLEASMAGKGWSAAGAQQLTGGGKTLEVVA
jgi:hypothetical protein